MTSEKHAAGMSRNALLSTRAKTDAERLALRRTTLRLAGQIDAAKSAEQLFTDFVASPGCFIRITAAEHRIRAGMWRSMRKLVDLQALRIAVETAKAAANGKLEFTPGAPTPSGQLADNTARLIPATSTRREAPLVNGFEFSNHTTGGHGQARVDPGAASPPENGFEFSNDQIAARPSPSKKAKVIPIDAYRPPRSPTAA